MFQNEIMSQATTKIARLEELSGKLLGELEQVSPAQLDYQPAPKEWTIKEIVCYLRDVDEIFVARSQKMIDEDEPFLRAYNPEEMAEENYYSRAIFEEALVAFQHNRERTLKFFKGLDAAEWLKPGFHQELGRINVSKVLDGLINQTETYLERIQTNKRLAL